MTSSYPATRIMTLLPMACDGVGPSFTCLHIAGGMHLGGQPVEVFAIRRRVARSSLPPSLPLHVVLPGLLAWAPYQRVVQGATRRLEQRFLAALRPGDIAYLWPSVSLQMHKTLHNRGIPVVLEGINTRMKSARAILDAAYDAFGIAPAHGITDERIAEEEEKYHLAAAIFAPNREVERALAGSPLQDRFLPASYGVDVSRASPERQYDRAGDRSTRPLTFLFCGYACVRKGVHHLLDAWARMDGPHKLQFIGRIEPAIAERYRDLLASDRVQVVGFVQDVHPWFAKADVFLMPSLEEGGPQVTYEAALHGLPIIASPMGAARIGDTEGALLTVDPARTDDLVQAMTRLAEDADLRATLGREARTRAFGFDWADVGARRGRLLQAAFPGGTGPDV